MINRATMYTVFIACSGLLINANTHAAFTEIKPNTVKINGTKYWRAKADEAKIGSLGVKRTPVGSANFFEKMQNAPNGIYNITVGDPYIITSQQATELGVSASVSNGAVTGSASGEVSKNNSANMSIYKLSIDLGNKKGNLRKETNLHNKHLTALKELGDKARMINAVWIMVDGNESQSSCYSVI